MIQFLKPKGNRHQSALDFELGWVDQFPIDLISVESEADAKEQFLLIEEEEAAIRLAFQQQAQQVVNVADSAYVLTAPCADLADELVSQLSSEEIPTLGEFAISAETLTETLVGMTTADRIAGADNAVAEHHADLLNYFQTLSEEDNNRIQELDPVVSRRVPASHRSSAPKGLIGAGVLVTTLIAGAVIVDTVKPPSFKAEKKSLQTAARSSVTSKKQNAAMLMPQLPPPAAMPSKLPLPKPRIGMTSQPISSPLLTQFALPKFALPIAEEQMPEIASPQTTAIPSPPLVSRSNQLESTPETTVGNAPATGSVDSPVVPIPAVPPLPSVPEAVEPRTSSEPAASSVEASSTSALVPAHPVSARFDQGERLTPAERPQDPTIGISRASMLIPDVNPKSSTDINPKSSN
jgi:hypothetical protein